MTVVLLHGRGSDPASMEQLGRAVGLYEVIAPGAPGGTWYPDRFTAPRSANEPHLSTALGRVQAILDALPPERTLLGGFSQGACLACEALAQRPRRLRAFVGLSGGLIGADEDELVAPPPGVLDGVPVLLTAIEDDGWVPVERARRSADIFRAAGADVELIVHPPAPHGVQEADLAAFRELLSRTRS